MDECYHCRATEADGVELCLCEVCDKCESCCDCTWEDFE